MQASLPLVGGWHDGPLFIIQKRKQPKRPGTRAPGTVRRRSERRATPKWVDRAALRALFLEAKRMTRETGITHARVRVERAVEHSDNTARRERCEVKQLLARYAV